MAETPNNEIFSFHLARIPLIRVPTFLRGIRSHNIEGLRHAESLVTMGLGEPIASARRYQLRNGVMFAWWEDESSLEKYLSHGAMPELRMGWHVRMKLYRKWGEISELREAIVDPSASRPSEPVVAVTLARLKFSETMRFITWGHPVERQVRDHPGKTLALAAFRPSNTFSTFSIWKNEAEMLSMVHKGNADPDLERHKRAMQEMRRKNFHHEFSTMRFTPIGEYGSWEGHSGFIHA